MSACRHVSHACTHVSKIQMIIVLLTRCLNWFTFTVLAVSTGDTGYAHFVVALWYIQQFLESAWMIRDGCYGNFQSKLHGLPRIPIDPILTSLITRNHISGAVVNLAQRKQNKKSSEWIISYSVTRNRYA